MPAIKKILFPVDFSAQCVGAARHVEALAGWFQAEVMLFHVVGNGTNTLAEELKPRSQERLNAFLAGELKHFTTQRVCVVGDPVDKIVEMAKVGMNPVVSAIQPPISGAMIAAGAVSVCERPM